MKSISILGTSSDAGKSWLNTAFCALMRKNGVNVAPFKAQNMSNNSFVTLEGGEIGRAQAAQAEACGLRPIAEMNPVLLKPSGDMTAQVVELGKPGAHVRAGSYYKGIESYRDLVRDTLDWWKSRCDLLLIEGAGSPVELNLMDRDVVNLFPVEYLDGRWVLVADIERGGVFAQAIGTVNLMPKTAQKRGLGIVVNKFRGDISLFADADKYFSQHIETPYLGVLPMRYDLQPETEDGFSLRPEAHHQSENLPLIAWVCFPRISNSQDIQPWSLDRGVQVKWVRTADALESAAVIVLPGTKNTIADLEWLNNHGLAEVIMRKAATGTPVIGICGGFQMLGKRLSDPLGVAGQVGEVEGLGLLPIETVFESEKRVTQVEALWGDEKWSAYEIHMGVTRVLERGSCERLMQIRKHEVINAEGVRKENICGTYLHGYFEAAVTREHLCRMAKIQGHQAVIRSWFDYKQDIYRDMAELLEAHIDLKRVYKYVGL